MPYDSPGINPRETDFSFYVKSISSSQCAMIGLAEKGPIGKATLITSWEQYLRIFGGYYASGYLTYAVRAFFDNGGGILWVVRTAHYTDITDKTTLVAAKATKTLKDRAEVTPLDTLKVDAINEGKWGEKLSVVIEDSAVDAANLFNLTVKLNGAVVEVWKDLSMVDTHERYAEIVINEVSKYITVSDLDAATAAPADRPATGTFALAAGDDGVTGIADTDYVGDSSQHTGLYALDNVTSIRTLVIPGVTSLTVLEAADTYCSARKNLVWLGDTPYGVEPQDAIDFRNGAGDYTGTAFNSSYGALYYPWVNIADPITGKTKAVPPSGFVAGIVARSHEVARVWAAPAGLQRGRLRNVQGLVYDTSKAERDVLYPQGINCLVDFPEDGVLVYGQKTLQTLASATDRLNVRYLMMFIEGAISNSSRFVVFEPHNKATWQALLRLVDPFMRGIQNDGGVYEYALQCDDDTNPPEVIDRNELVMRVFVKATKTAEFVELNFILTSTGASFSELMKAA